MEGVPHDSFQDTIIEVEVSELIYRDKHFKETGRTRGKVLEGREASGW